MHVPQSVVTENELIELAAVPTQIISPRECKPIISVVQDVALGIYRLTKPDVKINRSQFFNLLAHNTKFLGDVPPPHRDPETGAPYWTGRQALSMIIPDNINITSPNKSYQSDLAGGDRDNYVIIENGELIQGIVDKTIYQNRTRGLVHSIFNECGPEETRQFFDNTQRLICDWLVADGFSVGISDLMIPGEDLDKMHRTITDMKREVYDNIRKIHENKFDFTAALTTKNDYFELKVNEILNNTIGKVGKMGMSKINDKENRMINMVKSGSKGSPTNVSQMIACLGQQNVEGRRIAYGFDDRTLPHYTKYDDGPESRGFVENSFVTGLTPQEFFFHAMGGREGLIDTAVKSVTGDTPIIIIENEQPKYVLIGDWIDQHIDSKYGKLEKQVFEKDRNMEFLNLTSKVYIPTADNHGNTSWGEMTAVTRHDPGERLYKVRTRSGREVTVAESKTLLIWDSNKKEFFGTDSRDIKIGDYIPTIQSLKHVPIITKFVDMEQYFPKNTHIWGTEFNKAWKMMDQAMKGRIQIPRGWWNEHNGKSFITPYTKKSSLTRATSGRSCTDNILDGFIYPYHATRECSLMPDKFVLDTNNGIFIGLFLSEGSTHEKSGKVSIANIDTNVKNFVKKWFDKNKIIHAEYSRQMKVGTSPNYGTTTSIQGSSTLLVRFLDAFVGHGAHNKYVPDVAFTAPKEFITGLLNGYIAGDGTVDGYRIQTSSVSRRLTEGIATLCNRLGVFGYISTVQNKSKILKKTEYAPSHVLNIRSHWAQKFADQVDCLIKYKDDKLQSIKPSTEHINYSTHNNVVLDSITHIEIISPENYPKLYDVTVPSTINFMIANGIVTEDTSETGYLQRKLVKAMEDCKITFDNTVRNANGSIIQFLYGEDGMDATKIESQNLHYIDLDFAALKRTYLLTKSDSLAYLVADKHIKQLDKPENWNKLRQHFDIVRADRDYVIKTLFNYRKESGVMYPISFARSITTARTLFADVIGSLNDIDPMYVLSTIDELCEELRFKNRFNPGNRLLQILIRSFLSPKRVVCEYKLDKLAFDYIVNDVRHKFYDAIAHPSEMVGVIAAQSIGEPTTQMTLNSIDWNEEILLKINKMHYQRLKIGDYIDKCLENIDDVKIEKHDNDTTLGWIKDQNVKILSCDEYGEISWKKIEAVTRHPVINKDGTDTLLKITTRSGRSVTATKAKSFLKRGDNKILPVNGDSLQVGDYLPVSKVLPINENVTHLDMSWYLPKTEYIYMTEVEKAIELSKTHRNYWGKHKGKDFELPYSRSDAFRFTFINKQTKQQNKNLQQVYKSGCVYPKKTCITTSEIPEHIKLDTDFGFFVGAYLSEGHVTDSHVLISNVDENFLNIIRRNLQNFNVNYHMDTRYMNGGFSKTLRLHSTVFAKLFHDAFGKGSSNKKIPAWVLAAPDRFIGGLMNGYFSGDGTLGKIKTEVTSRNTISATSTSRVMLESLQQILLRYDIVSWITFHDTKKYEAKYNKFDEVQDAYKLNISCGNTKKFADVFGFVLKLKQIKLEKMVDFEVKYEYGRYDTVPDIELSDGTHKMHRDKITQLLNKTKNKADKEILQDILDENIMYDEIVSIEEVAPSHKYVYDFTVKDTRNFNIFNGLCIRDTFHLSGVSSASTAVRGVPRIKELLSVTKNIKTPVMTICVKEQYRQDKEKCKEILNSIQTTYFRDIVEDTKIFYDPDDDNSQIDDDRFFVKTYRHFIADRRDNLSPMLLRFQFSKEKMLEYNVTMMDIHHTLTDFYNIENRNTSEIEAIFSDDNAEKLVLRLKLEKNADRDIITELEALKKSILDMIITGVKQVNKVVMNKKEYPKYNDELLHFENTWEWILETSGTNLIDILSHKYIDPLRTVSNDINEIVSLLGIEAARQVLYNEIYEVISSASLFVNYRHIALLVDTMTNRGYLLSIDRHGINRGDIGPLAKCSFEETTDMLIKAGAFSELDRINGVSANIMLGQLPPAGTGDTDILIDYDVLNENVIEFSDYDSDSDGEIIDSDEIINMDKHVDISDITIHYVMPKIDNEFNKYKTLNFIL